MAVPKLSTTLVGCAIAVALIGSGYHLTHMHEAPVGAASVNGTSISAATIQDLENSGVSHADALDRAITARVTALAAETRYAEDSAKALSQMKDAALSNLYIQKRLEELTKQVTDTEIEQLYAEQVTDAAFRAYKLKFVVLPDLEQAQAMYQQLQAGDRSAKAKLMPLTKDDAFVSARELPYNLGVVAARANAGEVLAPVEVRNGVLVLVVDAAKTLAKPSLDSIKTQLRNTVANQKFGEELKQLRSQAQIELHS